MGRWTVRHAMAATAVLIACLSGCSGSQVATPPTAAETSGQVSTSPATDSGATAAGGHSQVQPRIVFILDASGSMLGKVGNEEKMVVARRVLKDAIVKLPDNADVGLIAYGHRRKNDCADIELLSPLKPVDKLTLAQQIDALKPSGMTPITNSLQQAFDVVKSQSSGGRTTVVLVSDGLETCNGDPCKLARDAKQAGLDFVLHVIGFDVGKVKVAQLECVAQAGGGLYLGAQNAEELAAALAGAVSPSAVADGRLSIKAVADGKLTDAVVNVRRAATTDDITGGRTYDAPDTNPRVLPLPAGDYDVTVTAVDLSGAPTLRFEKVSIQSGQLVEKTADFSAGELAITVVRNGKPSDAVVQVFAAGSSQEIAGGRTYQQPATNPLVLRVAPGKYEVVVKSNEIPGGPTLRLTDVVVEGAGQVKRTADFSSGTLRIGASQSGQLIDAVVTVTNNDTGKETGLRTYTAAATNPRSFELMPGQYRIRIAPVKPPGLRSQEISVEVKAGETVERVIEFK